MVRAALFALALLAAVPVRAEGPPRTLAVAAASSLKAAAEELEQAFEAEQAGVDVVLTFGASGAFFAQLGQGAPFDVFLSADREYPARVVAAGLGSDERVYALGELAAWLPPGSRVPLAARGLAALTDPAVRRIAMANPAVAPFGRATEAALRAAGVYDAVKAKLVLGASVAQAAQFATTGAADVAFLPRSLTSGKALAGGTVVLVPASLYPPIAQSGVVLAAARQPALARAFLAFVAGARGPAILARCGYGLP